MLREPDCDLPGNGEPDINDRRAAGKMTAADIDADEKRRKEKQNVEDWFEQRRDRKQMAAEDVARARDLIHAYGDARVNTAAWEAKKEVYAAKAADAFAKLMLLVAELAKGAYE